MYVVKYLPLLHGLLIFSDDQQSKIGQVSAIDSDEHLPVTLRLWKPSIKAISLVTARFTQALNDDSLTRLRPEQILLNNLNINSEGHLKADSQQRVWKLLRKPRVSTPRDTSPSITNTNTMDPSTKSNSESKTDNEVTADKPNSEKESAGPVLDVRSPTHATTFVLASCVHRREVSTMEG